MGEWDMVVVEVGGPIWWGGFGILVLFFLGFFVLAPRAGHPKFAQWEKILGWTILA
ncbi:MAG: hypothetical protein RJA06_266, partial [Bacteroidota bacterium]